MSRSSHTASYEVVLHITGWCPGYAWSIKIGVEGALLARGFDGHIEILSVRELPAPESLVHQDPAPAPSAGGQEERKRS